MFDVTVIHSVKYTTYSIKEFICKDKKVVRKHLTVAFM